MHQRRLVICLGMIAFALATSGLGVIGYAIALGTPADRATVVAAAVMPPAPPAPFDPEERMTGGVAGLFESLRHSIMLGEVSAQHEAVEPVAAAAVDPVVASAPAPVVATARAPAFEVSMPPWPPARPASVKALTAYAPLASDEASRISLADIPAPPPRPASLKGLTTLASLSSEVPVARAAVEPAPEAVAPAPVPTPAPMPPDRSGQGPFQMGSPAYVRIFKREGQLELWLQRDGRYALFRTYAICKWSGTLGPKLKEGDYQSPEGFYEVSARQLNPHSHYDRAFDVGFPNAFDRRQGYTGGAVMVHGDCKSVGCFAMTNPKIEEIYAYVEAAIRNGQREVPVHIFPFRMTEAALKRETRGDWTSLWMAEHANLSSFWSNLKEGYDLFEQTGEPPTAYACGDRYEFGAMGKSCARIAGW